MAHSVKVSVSGPRRVEHHGLDPRSTSDFQSAPFASDCMCLHSQSYAHVTGSYWLRELETDYHSLDKFLCPGPREIEKKTFRKIIYVRYQNVSPK